MDAMDFNDKSQCYKIHQKTNTKMNFLKKGCCFI